MSNTPFDFTGSKLVLVGSHVTEFYLQPSLSTGNVGQLAIDAIIATFSLEKAGTLSSPYVVPMIGNDAIGVPKGVLVTALEVFYCPEQHVAFLQQRAPIIKGKQAHFVRDILAWYTSCSMTGIILLGSMDKVTRMDDSLVVG